MSILGRSGSNSNYMQLQQQRQSQRLKRCSDGGTQRTNAAARYDRNAFHEVSTRIVRRNVWQTVPMQRRPRGTPIVICLGTEPIIKKMGNRSEDNYCYNSIIPIILRARVYEYMQYVRVCKQVYACVCVCERARVCV